MQVALEDMSAYISGEHNSVIRKGIVQVCYVNFINVLHYVSLSVAYTVFHKKTTPT